MCRAHGLIARRLGQEPGLVFRTLGADAAPPAGTGENEQQRLREVGCFTIQRHPRLRGNAGRSDLDRAGPCEPAVLRDQLVRLAPRNATAGDCGGALCR